ncbi:hypothetical protein [Mycobacteroides abscessus]|uniref:hypothetical protein n=1 Tax=Mycobacteroides abscessus TaxID=36809 RepID=UPI000C25D710|nr:hypothetical protein [Mycobacteroides abscessus]AWG55010.1 hypothetical protein DDT53_12740 [Mycobacteroides abscessus]MDQ8119592.1 hypothetical protein [Mycobacteroides abscessus subsp. massiliense]
MKTVLSVLIALPVLAACSNAEAAEAERVRCERAAAAAPSKFAGVRVPIELAVKAGVPSIVRLDGHQVLAAGELLADADDCEIDGLSKAWGIDLRAWGQPPPPSQ